MEGAAVGSEPLYLRVERDLASRISDGAWQPGDYLPSEQALQQRYQVSRTTIRKAVGDLVIDGSPLSVTPPGGGSATFFGSGAVFGFDFTSFNTFDTFKFKWDPDSTLSSAYGASGFDFVGARVTAVTSAGVYAGQFGRVGDTADVSAVLSPVPEPAAYLMALAGVLALGARRRFGRR